MSTEKRPSRITLLPETATSFEERIAYYRHMQETQPIRYHPEYNLWEVFRYKDVQQVLSDYATFAAYKVVVETFPSTFGKSEPPRHYQLRSLVAKTFTPRSLAQLRPRLVKIIDELLEPTKASGKMNVMTALAYPLPLRVFTEILGVPSKDQERIRQWSYQLLSQFETFQKPDYTELIHYFSEQLDERKRDPQDDLMSDLLVAEENGLHLTRAEIIDLCLELIFAGNVSTTVLLSMVIYRLCQHPELYHALRADPSLIPGAVEEALRYGFSTLNMWRTARHDTVFNGHEIKAGQHVVAWIAAANFDETYFPRAEQFDIRRSPDPHLTFGHGIHACLGAPLARLEGLIALERFVAHFSEIHLDPEEPVQYMSEIAPSLIKSLGIRLTLVNSLTT